MLRMSLLVKFDLWHQELLPLTDQRPSVVFSGVVEGAVDPRTERKAPTLATVHPEPYPHLPPVIRTGGTGFLDVGCTTHG
jgi:hypothetical protein